MKAQNEHHKAPNSYENLPEEKTLDSSEANAILDMVLARLHRDGMIPTAIIANVCKSNEKVDYEDIGETLKELEGVDYVNSDVWSHKRFLLKGEE